MSAALAGLILSFVLVVAAHDIVFRDRPFPGVRTFGVSVGGLASTDVGRAVQRRFDTFASQSVRLRVGDTTWTSSPAELGLTLDVTSTTLAAMEPGRRGPLLDQLRERGRLLLTGQDIAPVVDFDPALAGQVLAKISLDIAEAPVDAKLIVRPDGGVEVQPAVLGKRLDEAGALAVVEEGLRSLGAEDMALPVKPVPATLDAEALARAQADGLALIAQPVVLTAEDHEWIISAGELAEAARVTADADGRPRVELDQARADALLDRVVVAIERQPEDAKLAATRSGVGVVMEREGVQVDRAATIRRLRERQGTFDERIPVALLSIAPRITNADLAPALDRAQGLVGKPITVTHEQLTWTIGTAELLDALDLDEAHAGPLQRAFLRHDALAAIARAWAEDVATSPRDARFRFRGGQVRLVAEDVQGVGLAVDETATAIAAAAETIDRTVKARTHSIPAAVRASDRENIVIRELIAETSSSYAGSIPERAHNVELATSRLDGVMIPPGAEFSFNRELGPQTIANGYRIGYGIALSGDQAITVPSEAGGICQVATTLFQSVFWGGFKILERNTHFYWIPRYGQPPRGLVGLDATVDDQYDVDFRFRNNSSAWLAIRSWTADGLVHFALYGTESGWQVQVAKSSVSGLVKANQELVRQPDDTMPEGKTLLVEHAEDGFTVEIERIVTRGGETVDHWSQVRTYTPSRNVLLVGTKKMPATVTPPEVTPATTPPAASSPVAVATPGAAKTPGAPSPSAETETPGGQPTTVAAPTTPAPSPSPAVRQTPSPANP